MIVLLNRNERKERKWPTQPMALAVQVPSTSITIAIWPKRRNYRFYQRQRLRPMSFSAFSLPHSASFISCHFEMWTQDYISRTRTFQGTGPTDIQQKNAWTRCYTALAIGHRNQTQTDGVDLRRLAVTRPGVYTSHLINSLSSPMPLCLCPSLFVYFTDGKETKVAWNI